MTTLQPASVMTMKAVRECADDLTSLGYERRKAMRMAVALCAALASGASPSIADAGAPLLMRLMRFLFSRHFVAEQYKGVGMIAGNALRHAIRPVAAATRMTGSQMLTNGAALGMIGLSAYQLTSVFRPELIDAMARRAPDVTVDRAQQGQVGQLGYVELGGSEPVEQNTFITSSVAILPQQEIRHRPEAAAGIQLHGGQRVFRAGETPSAVIAVPDLTAGEYVLFGSMRDHERQRYYEESGNLPTFRVLEVK